MSTTATEVLVSPAVLDALRHHAHEQPEREVCGVLLGVWGAPTVVDGVVRGINILHARDRYMLDAASLLQADDAASARGGSVVGFYHSHPNQAAIPSISDRQTAWHGFVYLIVSTDAAHAPAICAWTIDHALRVHPLLLIEPKAPSNTR